MRIHLFTIWGSGGGKWLIIFMYLVHTVHIDRLSSPEYCLTGHEDAAREIFTKCIYSRLRLIWPPVNWVTWPKTEPYESIHSLRLIGRTS